MMSDGLWTIRVIQTLRGQGLPDRQKVIGLWIGWTRRSQCQDSAWGWGRSLPCAKGPG